jgi:hypothetical protein
MGIFLPDLDKKIQDVERMVDKEIRKIAMVICLLIVLARSVQFGLNSRQKLDTARGVAYSVFILLLFTWIGLEVTDADDGGFLLLGILFLAFMYFF